VRPNDDLPSLANSILGVTRDFATLGTEAVGWTTNGVLGLKVSCVGCPAYVYATARPGEPAEPAQEPVLAAATRPAYSPWLGRFEDWILVSDLSGIIARSANKNVLLFPLDGYAANAAWPAGMHLLPAAS